MQTHWSSAKKKGQQNAMCHFVHLSIVSAFSVVHFRLVSVGLKCVFSTEYKQNIFFFCVCDWLATTRNVWNTHVLLVFFFFHLFCTCGFHLILCHWNFMSVVCVLITMGHQINKTTDYWLLLYVCNYRCRNKNELAYTYQWYMTNVVHQFISARMDAN